MRAYCFDLIKKKERELAAGKVAKEPEVFSSILSCSPFFVCSVLPTMSWHRRFSANTKE